jgi:protein SCO1/2
MKRNVKITLIVCLVWVFLVMFITYNRYASNNQTNVLDAEELREIGALIYEAPVALEPFELIDHHGAAFTDASLQGKWSLIFFGFTNCPDICPLTMQELTSFYRSLEGSQLQSDTQVVMVSVDPFRDDTPTVARYMSAFDPSFLGVTGEFSTVSRLASSLFVATGIMPVPAPDGGVPRNFLIDHSGNILIVDPSGQYRGFMEPNIKRDNIKQAYELIRQAL